MFLKTLKDSRPTCLATKGLSTNKKRGGWGGQEEAVGVQTKKSQGGDFQRRLEYLLLPSGGFGRGSL